ncbi:MAG: CAP domain-containing protein [Terriglobia bacterium]
MNGSAKFGIFTACGILVMAASLAVAGEPKPDVQPAVVPEGAAVGTISSTRSLAKLSDPACPAGAACLKPGELAREMVELIDADRLNAANEPETGGHAQPLRWDARLAEAALAHSRDMAARHYFSHIDPNGNSPVERVTKAGVPWRALGENIAKNFSISGAEEAFMNEPRFQRNHRANILNPGFNCVGIGVVKTTDGMVYVTQEFAQEQ